MSKYPTPKPYRVHLRWAQMGGTSGGPPPEPTERVLLTMAYDPSEALAQAHITLGPVPSVTLAASVDAVDWDHLSAEDRAFLEAIRAGKAPDGSLGACLPRDVPPTPRG